ncbi:MAG: molybdenum cofactor guanylyltransferase [Spirochaetes bacterium]|nr:molybdenum cofactor guanylyltransferase [Spirochaetota bacterium]
MASNKQQLKLNPCSAILLAGGKSKRMGQDKAYIDFLGKPLIEYILAKLLNVFSEIVVVTGHSENFHHGQNTLFVNDLDEFKGMGPLAGIYTGLQTISTQCAFVTACDMPLISENTILKLIKSFKDNHCQVLFARNNLKIEPLLAVYSINCSNSIYQMLKGGNKKVQAIASLVETDFLDIHDQLEILNINTPADLEKAIKLKSLKYI